MTKASHGDEVERRLAVQYAVSRALAESETVDGAMQRVLRELGRYLEWRVGAYWAVDDGGDLLHPLTLWSADPEPRDFVEATRTLALSRGIGLPGLVWASGEPAWIPNLLEEGRDFPRHAVAYREGLRGGFGFPVHSGPAVIGVVELYNDRVGSPDDSLKEAVRGIGYQIGQFIARKVAIDAETRAQRRNAAILETALDCIIMIDAGGCVLEWNPAAERTFGRMRDEAVGKQMADLIVPPRFRKAHYDGLRRYLATGEAHVLGRRIEIEGLRADGVEFPVELAITRVPLPGRPTFTAYLRDLTERKRLEFAQTLLLEASTLLASSLDYEQTLSNLARVVVPSFADWYAIDIVEPDGNVRRLAVAHRDPARTELAQELAQRYPEDPDSAHGVYRAIRTGESELVAEIPDSLLVSETKDPEHLRLVRELGLRSYIVVPLRSHGGVIGAFSFVTAESARRYDERDLSVAEELARRAAQAIDNARLFREVTETRELLEHQAVELEAQAAELEETAQELEHANEELQHTNEALVTRSSEAELARREADEANRAKSDFLAAMSHELRTPLNAIVGYAQLMDVGVHGPVSDSQREDIKRIERSSQHLLGLITDILNFAKTEAGRVSYQIETVAMDAVLARVEEMVAPQAQAKQLRYSYTNECPDAFVRADPDKLLQIFVNLLSNAVRFTPDGGRIDVRCYATDEAVSAEVTDTGMGIPPDKLDAIFEPFVQVDLEYAGQRQGTGLGLAISRELARGMDGDLTVTSEPGEGSTFTIRLKREVVDSGAKV